MAKSAALQREPREKARRIKARIPRRLLNPERRSFLAPFGEKKRLLQVAEEHHFLKPEKWLLAHGTSDLETLCQILSDKELVHDRAVFSTYGRLWSENWAFGAGGHLDDGAGVFVVLQSVLARMQPDFYKEKHWKLPLGAVDAVLLPKKLSLPVKEEFPEQERRIFSYGEYAQKLWKEIRLDFYLGKVREFFLNVHSRVKQD